MSDEERCGLVGTDQVYMDYHDTEWGIPEYDSRALWEKLILDGFQAGLSWITILKKRDDFRTAFANFDPNIVADWGRKQSSLFCKTLASFVTEVKLRQQSPMPRLGKGLRLT